MHYTNVPNNLYIKNFNNNYYLPSDTAPHSIPMYGHWNIELITNNLQLIQILCKHYNMF